MNLFGIEPQELAMRRLIHDTNSALSSLRYVATEAKLDDEQRKNWILSQSKRIEKAIDEYYIKFQNDFKNE